MCKGVFRDRALPEEGLVPCVRKREAASFERYKHGIKAEKAAAVYDVE